MSRLVVPVMFSVALVFGFVGSVEQLATAQDVEVAAVADVTSACPVPEPEDVDARPWDLGYASVVPMGVESSDGETRELYLAEIRLAPGACMPFEAVGNRKDGAVVWMVQQGKVEYVWREASEDPPAETPTVLVGDITEATPGDVPSDEPILLYPGNWVTQESKVEVSYTNVGADTAILVKAVYATFDLGGCPGDCR